MHGVGLGSLHSSQAYRSRETAQVPKASTDAQARRVGCGSTENSRDTQRQAVYQSVVLVLREKFAVSTQPAAPVAGLTQAEQVDNQLAATVGAALNGSADMPPEQVGAVAEVGLQQALGTADAGANGLGDLGDIAADIRARVRSLVAAFVAARQSGSTEMMTAAKVSTKERGVLEIHTLEGDVVKIDFRNSTSIRLGSAEVAGGTQESLKVRISERTSLQVEGDLNPAELAAIGDLVRKVDSLANEFFSGNVEQALAAAAGLKVDNSQLADFSLQLAMSQKVRIRTVEALAPAIAAPAALQVSDTGSQAPVVSGQPVSHVSSGATASPPVVAPEDPGVAQPVPSAASGTTETNAEAIANVKELIGSFVTKLRASFSMSATDTGLGMTTSIKLSILTAAIESHSLSTPATPAAAANLADVAGNAGI